MALPSKLFIQITHEGRLRICVIEQLSSRRRTIIASRRWCELDCSWNWFEMNDEYNSRLLTLSAFGMLAEIIELDEICSKDNLSLITWLLVSSDCWYPSRGDPISILGLGRVYMGLITWLICRVNFDLGLVYLTKCQIWSNETICIIWLNLNLKWDYLFLI